MAYFLPFFLQKQKKKKLCHGYVGRRINKTHEINRRQSVPWIDIKLMRSIGDRVYHGYM
jgi:hypothetical protein